MHEIREATRDDIPALLRLGEQFCLQHPLVAIVGYDLVSLERTIEGIIENTEACAFVAVVDGEVAGGVLGLIVAPYFNLHAKAAHEIAWFVNESFRRGRIATQLFEVFESWAREHNANVIVCAALMDSPGVEGFYRLRGYQPCEIQYAKGQETLWPE